MVDAPRRSAQRRAGQYRDGAYFAEIQARKDAWEALKRRKEHADTVPMTQARAIHEIQAASDADAIVVTGAGLPQAIVKQNWVTREPRTHITSGGFSTMGFTLPGAIGAKLGRPDRQVVGIAGDGDFLQTMQELATAALLDLPVVFVVLDNSGWMSIKGGQHGFFGRSAATDFLRPDGSLYSPTTGRSAPAFGLHAEPWTSPGSSAPRWSARTRRAARRSWPCASAADPSTRSTRRAGGTRRSRSSIPSSARATSPAGRRSSSDDRPGDRRCLGSGAGGTWARHSPAPRSASTRSCGPTTTSRT